tara:strand:+ start:4258 stop:5379 length:1122 start_codon:yes stop_codon:yes gene_type:complete
MNNISLTQINRNSNNVSSSKKTTEDNAKKNNLSIGNSNYVSRKNTLDFPSTFIKLSPSLGGIFEGEKIELCISGKTQNQYLLASYKGAQLLLMTNNSYPIGKIIEFQVMKTNNEEALGYIKINDDDNLNEKNLIKLIVLDNNKLPETEIINSNHKIPKNFSWESLNDIIVILNSLDSKITENLVTNKLPRLSADSTISLMKFLAIIQNGNIPELFNIKLLKLLKNIGKKELAEKLKSEFNFQSNSLNNTKHKSILVPFFLENNIFPTMYSLKDKQKNIKEAPNIEFLIDFKLTNIGPVHFYGSLKYNKLDLTITTSVNLEPKFKIKLFNLFQTILSKEIEPGNVVFKVKNKFMGFVTSRPINIESKAFHEIVV